jgi:RNA polymerase sigma-70 factor, ECF subfamily
MTEELVGHGDPVIRRLQQAFAHEEPLTELAAVIQRAARDQAGSPPGPHDPPRPGHDLTPADLAAARLGEPAAVTRVYTAYAPALFRFFMDSVGDRHLAEDLTGSTFVSLPNFRGRVEALGGWLFQIARHDLYDHRRRQARSRVDPVDRDLGTEAAFWKAQLTQTLAIGYLEDAQVVAALQELSSDQREVLLLRMAAGLTAPEVAELLGKTTGSVKALQHRGLNSLARVLGLRSLREAQERPYPSPDPDRLTSQEEEEEG